MAFTAAPEEWFVSDGISGHLQSTLTGIRSQLCRPLRTLRLLGRATATGFARSMRTRVHLKVSPGCASRRLHAAIVLPGNANRAVQMTIVTGNRGMTRTATTKTSVIKSRSLVRSVRGNVVSFSILVTAPSMVPRITGLNHRLNPQNLVPSPGNNAIAFSLPRTVSRFGTNGLRFQTSGAKVIRIVFKGTSFDTRSLLIGLGTLRRYVSQGHPSKTGKHC